MTGLEADCQLVNRSTRPPVNPPMPPIARPLYRYENLF